MHIYRNSCFITLWLKIYLHFYLQVSDKWTFATATKNGRSLIPSSRGPILHPVLTEVETFAMKPR